MLRAHAGGYAVVGGTLSFHITRRQYPDPPLAFRLNPDAESMWLRYQGYLDGREPLQGMAYFCLTVLEATTGGRKHAAERYRIDLQVLNKIGKLTSEHGDPMSRRKATALRPLTGSEREWLEAAVKMMIWQLGDTRDASALPVLKMSDLPRLCMRTGRYDGTRRDHYKR